MSSVSVLNTLSERLPVNLAHAIRDHENAFQWLIEDAWADQGVGIIGGEPKTCKSFLALDMAVSVACGGFFLGKYHVVNPGPVLLFAAEDQASVVRHRLMGISKARGARLEELDIRVIDVNTLRLDLEQDRQRLRQTVAFYQPRLLILDPFVRLHCIDENASGAVAPLLAYLRDLQRSYGTAIVVVHHARKRAGSERGGQALRGSSEFHAWGDSNFYLNRQGPDSICLSIEHRAAKSVAGINLLLVETTQTVALEVQDTLPQDSTSGKLVSAKDRILAVLGSKIEAVTFSHLRKQCKMRKDTLCKALHDLVADEMIVNRGGSYILVSGDGVGNGVPESPLPGCAREPEPGTSKFIVEVPATRGDIAVPICHHLPGQGPTQQEQGNLC